jgi:hypothetical protein
MYSNRNPPRLVGLPASPRLRLQQDRHESHTRSISQPISPPVSSRLRPHLPTPSSDQRDSSSTFRLPRVPENRGSGLPESPQRAYDRQHLQTSSRLDTSSSSSSSAGSSLRAAISRPGFSASNTSLEEDAGTPKHGRNAVREEILNQDRPGMNKFLLGYYLHLTSSLRIRTRQFRSQVRIAVGGWVLYMEYSRRRGKYADHQCEQGVGSQRDHSRWRR